MAPRRGAIPPLPATLPTEAVLDYPCERCGSVMRIRRSGVGHWFYGCSRWPECHFTFDADQCSGAPIAHTRYGIPFRAETKDPKERALFRALRRNHFNLAAGQRLETASEQSRVTHRRALKQLERRQVVDRIKAASPTTPQDWVEFILSERRAAVEANE